jgi:hypothetical protein
MTRSTPNRWVRKSWVPEELAVRFVRAAGHIIPVPWTKQLREECREAHDQLRGLSAEVAYGVTGYIYAASPQTGQDSYNSLYADERPIGI